MYHNIARRLVFLTTFTLLGLTAATQAGAVIRVDLNAKAGGTGDSWATAYNLLSPALAAAAPGDSLWIAGQIPGDGVPLEELPAYTRESPGGARASTFELPGQVSLYGGFAGTEMSLAERQLGPYFTIISGDLNGDDDVSTTDNSYRVLLANGVTEVLLDGLYIVSGNANAGAPFDRGAGLSVYDSSITVRHCSFSLNNAAGSGGAVFADNSVVTMDNTAFGVNSALAAGGAVYVGGGTTLVMTNVRMVENHHFGGNGEAGGLYIADADATLINLTVAHNTTTQNFGGIFVHPTGSATMYNSIVWNNTFAQIGGSPSIVIGWSDVQGGAAGPENFSADPRFVDPDSFNYQLADDSPCIDRGNALEYFGPMTDGSSLQTNNTLRFVDAPHVVNQGVGSPDCLDLGAQEWQCVSIIDSCPVDIDNDGDVAFSDLLAVLSAWGPCP